MDGGLSMQGILLTEAQLQAWRDRLAELTATIKVAHDELMKVTRLITLAEELIALTNGAAKSADVTSEVGTGAAPEDDEASGPTASELIRTAIEALFRVGSRHKEAREIRLGIRRDDKVRALLDANPNQFYSVMHRMTKSGKLLKTRRGYRLPPSLETQLAGPGLFTTTNPGPSASNPAIEPQPRS